MRAALNDLQLEYEEKQEIHESLEEQLQQALNEAALLKTTLEDTQITKQQLTYLEREREKMALSSSSSMGELEDLRRKLSKNQEVRTALERERERIKLQLELERDLNKPLLRDLESAARENNLLRLAVGREQERSQNLQLQMEALSVSLTRGLEEAKLENAELTSIRWRVIQLEETINALQRELADAIVKDGESTDMDTLETDRLTWQLQELSVDLEQARNVNDSLRLALANNDKDNDKHRESTERVNMETSRLEAESLLLREANRKLALDLERATRENESLVQQRGGAEREQAGLCTQLEDADRRQAELEELLDVSRQQNDSSEGEHEGEHEGDQRVIRELEVLVQERQREYCADLSALRQQLADAALEKDRELTERDRASQELIVELEQARTVNDALQQQLSAAVADKDEAVRQMDEAIRQKDEAEEQVVELSAALQQHEQEKEQERRRTESSAREAAALSDHDHQRLSGLRAVDASLLLLADDRQFQEHLQRPRVQTALKCWVGGKAGDLSRSELEDIQDDEGVQEVYPCLKAMDDLCDKVGIRFPIDHIAASKCELSQEAIRFAYGPEFLAAHVPDRPKFADEQEVLFLERRLAWVVGFDAMTVATKAASVDAVKQIEALQKEWVEAQQELRAANAKIGQLETHTRDAELLAQLQQQVQELTARAEQSEAETRRTVAERRAAEWEERAKRGTEGPSFLRREGPSFLRREGPSFLRREGPSFLRRELVAATTAKANAEGKVAELHANLEQHQLRINQLLDQSGQTHQTLAHLEAALAAANQAKDEASAHAQELELLSAHRHGSRAGGFFELDRERLPHIREINDTLRRFALDEEFQASLRRPWVQRAVECWSGTVTAPLSDDDALAIKSDPGVRVVFAPLKRFEAMCNQYQVPFPMSELLRGAMKLPAEAIAAIASSDHFSRSRQRRDVEGEGEGIVASSPQTTPTRSPQQVSPQRIAGMGAGVGSLQGFRKSEQLAMQSPLQIPPVQASSPPPAPAPPGWRKVV